MADNVTTDGGAGEATPEEESLQEAAQPVGLEELADLVVAKLVPHVTSQVRQAMRPDLDALWQGTDRRLSKVDQLEKRAQRTESQVATLLKAMLPAEEYERVTAELEAVTAKQDMEARLRTNESIIRQLTAPDPAAQAQQQKEREWVEHVRPTLQRDAKAQGLTWDEVEDDIVALQAPEGWSQLYDLAHGVINKKADIKHREETPLPNAATTLASGARQRDYRNVPLDDIPSEEFEKNKLAIARALVARTRR